MTTTKPSPPPGLAVRGRAFWRQAVKEYDFDMAEVQLLTEVARGLDECEVLHGVVEEQGRTVRGSRGQLVAHPALAELRQTRLMLGRLLAQLALPNVDGVSLPSPIQARGRGGAAQRWGGQRRGTA